MKRNVIDIEYNGELLEVHYESSPYYSATYDQPEEGGEIDIIKINNILGYNILDRYSQLEEEQIIKLIIKQS